MHHTATKSLGQRTLALILSLVMLLGLLPITVLASNQVATPTYAQGLNPDDMFTGDTNTTLHCATEGATLWYTTDGSDPTTSSTRREFYYTESNANITISETTTIKAYAVKAGMDDSNVLEFTLTKADRVATPAFTPSQGDFSDSLNVTILCDTEDATIRYTTDGTEPSKTNGYTYMNPVTITDTTSFQAIAYKDGMNTSFVEYKTYTAADTVSFNANATYTVDAYLVSAGYTGSYYWGDDYLNFLRFDGATIVTDSNGTPTITLYGVNTGYSTPYNYVTALSLNRVSNFRFQLAADASDAAYSGTQVSTTTFTPDYIDVSGKYSGRATTTNLSEADVEVHILWNTLDEVQEKTATPTFNYNNGHDFGEETGYVTLTSTTPNAKIYYTTGEFWPAEPTTSSTLYTAPIEITGKTTIRAMAVADGYKQSDNTSASYTASPLLIALDANSTYTVDLSIQDADGGSHDSTFNKNYNSPITLVTDSDSNATVTMNMLYNYNYDTYITTMSILRKNGVPVALDYTVKGHGTNDGDIRGEVSFTLPYVDGTGIYTGTATQYELEWGAKEPTLTDYTINFTLDWNTLIKTGGSTTPETVATPVISPNGGEVEKGATASITCATDGATIYYTTDGTSPTLSSAVYATPVVINADTEIRAMAVKSGQNSDIVSASFTVKAEDNQDDNQGQARKFSMTVLFSESLSKAPDYDNYYYGEGLYGPLPTIYEDASGVRTIDISLISSYDSSYQSLYYTDMQVYTDAAMTQEASGIEFLAATSMWNYGYLRFTLTDNTTDTYYISATMNGENPVRTGTVTLDWSTLKEILTPVEIPVIAPAGGTLELSDTITLTCPTEGATIYYTLGDGWTNPYDYDGNLDPSAIKYEGPFSLEDATTVNAQASKDGMANSSTVKATFSVNGVSKKLGNIANLTYTTDSPDYDMVTLFTGDSMYEDIMTPSTGMPTVSEYYILAEQGDVSERHLWMGGIGGFFADWDWSSGDTLVKLLLAKDKWDADEDITLTIVAKGYDSKQLVVNLRDGTINSQENVTPTQDKGGLNRTDVEAGNTYTASFTAIKTGTQEESMLAGFFEPTAKIVVGTNGTTYITFRNMVMPEQLQDLGLKGSGDWIGAVMDGDRVESATEALFTIPVSTEDFKNGFFLGGVNVLAMGGAVSNNGAYDKYTSVEITFDTQVMEGFAGFESALNGLTEEKKVNRALMTISWLDDNEDGYISQDELANYYTNTYSNTLDLSSGVLTGVYSSFDDVKLKDISWVTYLPKTITSINLNGHQITAIGDEFKGFTALKSLNLRSNAIIGITDGAFSDLESLTDLGLSTNAIAKVTAGMFAGLVNLGNNADSEFSLAQNNIQTMEAGAFADLGKVKNFFLYENLLTSVPASSFTGMDSLERLELYSNRLRDIPVDVASMAKLTYLDLHANQITTVDGRLTDVTYLNLANNYISALPANFLATIPSAETVKLSGNDLKTLPADFVRLALSNDKLQDVFTNNPIDVKLLSGLSDAELTAVKELLAKGGVSADVVNLAISAKDKNITFTQDISAFDLHFWNYAISKADHESAIQAALGKNTIDSLAEYKAFRAHNLPSFSVSDVANSIFGSASNYVTDYTITTTLQKLVSGNWISVNTDSQSGGEDGKTGTFTDATMKAGDQYRLVKTIGTYAVIAYATATITEEIPGGGTGGAGGSTGGTTLKDGTYSVPVSVIKYGSDSEKSMANDAVVGTAQAVLKGDTITYTLTFKGMELSGLYGHLTNFWHYAAADTQLNDPMAPNKITYYTDYDMGGEEGGKTATFPSTVTFAYEGTTQDTVTIFVEVDAMNQNGTGKQNAVLVFNWDKAKADGGTSSGGSSGGVSSSGKEEKEDTVSTQIVTSGDRIGYEDFNAIISGGSHLVVNGNDGVKAQFSPDALKEIAKKVGYSNAQITLKTASQDNLSRAQQEAVGDRPVYEFTVKAGGNVVSNFGSGQVSITLPYTLADGESPSGVVVWYVDDEGNLEPVFATYADGALTFTVNHLSLYAVGYDQALTKVDAFTDVTADSWCYDAVRYALFHGLFNGTSETTFTPNTSMTRGMLVTVLHRLDGETQATDLAAFGDVTTHTWCHDAIMWAAESGVVNGYEDGTFGAGKAITREQMATFLYRYAGSPETKGTLSTYADADAVSGFATSAMAWAVENGIITGTTAGTLNPKGTATRAQVATILMRFAEM